jgi:hypothetical protein
MIFDYIKSFVFLVKSNIDNTDKEVKETLALSFDSNVNEAAKLLVSRSNVGIEKYGTTTDRDDYKPSEWCQHAIEEVCDTLVYMMRLKKELQKIESTENKDG